MKWCVRATKRQKKLMNWYGKALKRQSKSIEQ